MRYTYNKQKTRRTAIIAPPILDGETWAANYYFICAERLIRIGQKRGKWIRSRVNAVSGAWPLRQARYLARVWRNRG